MAFGADVRTEVVVDEPTTRAYRNGVLLAEGFAVDDISTFLASDDVVVWVDFLAPDAEQLGAIAVELELHDLAVEDALGPHQRPKVDFYDSHLFVAGHWLSVDPGSGKLDQTEVDAFVSDRWFITVRKNDRFPTALMTERWDRSSTLVSHGVAYFLYTLLDTLIDGYFAAVDTFDEFYDRVSEQLFSERPLEPPQQREWFEMRRSLVRFHRLVVPMRETVSGLMRREHDAINDDIRPYFQDVYDHVLRVSESTDSLRELVSTIVETNLSLREYRQNQIMKKVTSWAAIIAVPTLVTGFFGMNVPFPTSGQTWGVVVAVALMLVLSGFLYVLFRRRDWL